MKAPIWYEVDNWIEEREGIIGFVLDRNKVIEECLSIMLKKGVEELEGKSQCDLSQNTSHLETILEQSKSHLLQSIRETFRFVYWETAKFLYNKRVHSLLDKDYRINDYIRAQPIDWILELEEDGTIKDISMDTSIARPPGSSFGSDMGTPEQKLEDRECYERFKRLQTIIGSNGRLHALEYEKILNAELFDEIHVTPAQGQSLGIATQNVTSRRHEAFREAKRILLEECPDLRQTVENLTRGQNHKVRKSTKKQRDAFREKIEHGPIREWTREGGWKVISYEDALKAKKNRLAVKKKKKAV